MVECVGRPEVFPEGLKYLRKAGMYLEPGNFVDCGSTTINVHEICANNLRIIGMNNHTHTKYKTVMEMMLRTKNQFPWHRFFSHRYPLSATEEAIKTSMTKESMKVLINPWMDDFAVLRGLMDFRIAFQRRSNKIGIKSQGSSLG